MTIALRPAKGPVSRSCPYGGWENPTALSQPTTPRGIAASGSATNDSTVTTAAVTISTAVGENRPCRAGGHGAEREERPEAGHQSEGRREPSLP